MKKIYFALISLAVTTAFSQEVEEVESLPDTITLSPIQVTAELPITAEIISENDIEKKNLGQDMPILLKNATSVVSTSNAGSGIGYTSMRIRGIDQNQINVTFNGVPVNDSESHGVYWVDFPDVSSSTQGLLVQRGVGTSSNGAAAFGASVNLETDKTEKQVFANAMVAAGSFDTQKYMLNAGTGDFANGKLNFDGRLSYITSDGYVDRASSSLFSAAVNLRYKPSKNTEFHVMNLFGHEKTYQAWYGIEKAKLDDEETRTFNYAGAIYQGDEVKDYYDNQVDNYDQNHLHLYWKQKWNNGWKSTTTAHYTRGIGYYEEYKQGATLSDYLINNGIDSQDLVRRQWLDNHFVGGIFNMENTSLDNVDVFFGASLNHYIGNHYGTVKDVINSTYKPTGKYYQNRSNKTEFSSFAKVLYNLDRFELFGDLQFRMIDYDADYINNGRNDIKDFKPYDDKLNFFNPKAGVNYKTGFGKVYAAYGLTHREPTRADYLNNGKKPKAETLNDFEVGMRKQGFKFSYGLNLFYMLYKDQLVLTGKIDDVGYAIRENVGESYRRGIELDFNYKPLEYLKIFGNFTYNDSKNIDYKIEENGTTVNLGDTKISFTPEIISSFGIDLTPIDDLLINITGKYVSEQYLTNTKLSDGKLDDYFVTDLMLNYQFDLFANDLELSLMVNNLFDTKYANDGYYYGKAYYFPQAGTNFLAGLKFKF